MRKVKFKAGDKVYCPTYSTSILILETCGMADYPLAIEGCVAFNKHGATTPTVSGLSEIFHATPENHALLEQLYGVKFEAPPAPKNPKEIIQAMLDDGWHSVPCMLLATPEKLKKHLLLGVSDASRVNEKDIIPFDPKTGKAIVDYIDGKILTE